VTYNYRKASTSSFTYIKNFAELFVRLPVPANRGKRTVEDAFPVLVVVVGVHQYLKRGVQRDEVEVRVYFLRLQRISPLASNLRPEEISGQRELFFPVNRFSAFLLTGSVSS
jgi:hypothetical protein